MGEIIKIKLSLIKRLRLWWNSYKRGVSKRLEYLKNREKD